MTNLYSYARSSVEIPPNYAFVAERIALLLQKAGCTPDQIDTALNDPQTVAIITDAIGASSDTIPDASGISDQQLKVFLSYALNRRSLLLTYARRDGRGIVSLLTPEQQQAVRRTDFAHLNEQIARARKHPRESLDPLLVKAMECAEAEARQRYLRYQEELAERVGDDRKIDDASIQSYFPNPVLRSQLRKHGIIYLIALANLTAAEVLDLYMINIGQLQTIRRGLHDLGRSLRDE